MGCCVPFCVCVLRFMCAVIYLQQVCDGAERGSGARTGRVPRPRPCGGGARARSAPWRPRRGSAAFPAVVRALHLARRLRDGGDVSLPSPVPGWGRAGGGRPPGHGGARRWQRGCGGVSRSQRRRQRGRGRQVARLSHRRLLSIPAPRPGGRGVLK